MGDAAAWSPGVARRPPKKGGTGDLRVRLKEDKWNGRLSLEGLPRYDAMRDPNCPRAMSAIFNEQQRVKANKLRLEVGVKLRAAPGGGGGGEYGAPGPRARVPATRPVAEPVPLLGKGLPLLVVRTSDGGDASAAVTYEKIGAGYGTELELVRLALQRNEVLRMAHDPTATTRAGVKSARRPRHRATGGCRPDPAARRPVLADSAGEGALDMDRA